MGGNRRVDQLTPQGIQTRESPRLIDAHEARVTDHVGRQDRREPPLKALLSHVEKLRWPRHYGSPGTVSIKTATSDMGHPRPGRGAASPAASAMPPESGSNFRASAAPRPAVAVDGTAADVIQARKLEPASCAFRRNEIAKT